MMDNMPTKHHMLPPLEKSPKEQTKIPAHLMTRNGARQHEPAAPEPLSRLLLDLAVVRFEALMNDLNGGTLNSRDASRGSTRSGQADTCELPSSQKSAQKARTGQTEARAAADRRCRCIRIRGVLPRTA